MNILIICKQFLNISFDGKYWFNFKKDLIFKMVSYEKFYINVYGNILSTRSALEDVSEDVSEDFYSRRYDYLSHKLKISFYFSLKSLNLNKEYFL